MCCCKVSGRIRSFSEIVVLARDPIRVAAFQDQVVFIHVCHHVFFINGSLIGGD